MKRTSTEFNLRGARTSGWPRRLLAAAAILATLGVSAAVLLRFRDHPLDTIVRGGHGPPTVVLLHGYGATAEDWEPFLKTVTFPPEARLIFPKGPSVGGLTSGRGWWNLDLTTDPSTQQPPGIKTAAQLVENLLGEITGPVILGGFSQGAMVSAEVAFQSEQPLAALILLSGTTIDEASWVHGLRHRRGLRVFMSHGRRDPTLAFDVSDRFRAKMSDAGLVVTWLPFDGGHEVPSEVVMALNEFLATLPKP